MPAHIVLIDFENTLPKGLGLLADLDCFVRVFVGLHQRRASVCLVEAMRPLGTSAQFVRVEYPGKNALDFLLTFHLAQLATQHREAHFWIISQDRDFDSLTRHLQDMRISCNRVAAITDIIASQRLAGDREGNLSRVIEHLTRMNSARPRRTKTLRSTIRSLMREIDEPSLDALIATLQDKKVVADNGGTISYCLPSSPAPASDMVGASA